ncbi:MAG: hypothetical protein J7J93_01160 [Candidatus Aenigmarchaeota archaeon]|nr:hypothetical protein [Candidatus Aenigmarchaeota archaeon]
MVKIMLILGKGGHTSQILQLMKKLPKKYEYCFLVCYEDPISGMKVKGAEIYKASMPSVEGEPLFMAFFRSIKTFFQAINILIKSKVDVIITAGPGLGAVFSYAAKLLNKKIIFLETWSRVYSKSKAGRLSYPIADLFFVQWKQMKKIYPKAIYAGRLG